MGIINSVLPVIIMLLVGSLCRKKHIISEDGINGLQALVMNFTLPATVFGTFYKTSISAGEAVLPLTLFAVTAGGIFFGRLLGRLTGGIGTAARGSGSAEASVIPETASRAVSASGSASASASSGINRRLPFFLTGYEAGMVGYALAAILSETGDVATFAMIDVGHSIAIFTVYLVMLKSLNGEKQTAGEVVKGLVTTPVLMAILAGGILGFTGIGGKIGATAAGGVIDTVCDFVGAPTGAAILAVIGYRMKFEGLDWGKTLKVCALRLVQQLILGGAVLLIYRTLGGEFASRTVMVSVAVMFILPPPFILPLYSDDEESREFYSSAISVYTLITVACFAVLSGIVK